MPFRNALNLGAVLGAYSRLALSVAVVCWQSRSLGVTLANLPRTPHMTRQGLRMVAFHAELTFLVGSFFFVLLGIVADCVGRTYVLHRRGDPASSISERARQRMAGP